MNDPIIELGKMRLPKKSAKEQLADSNAASAYWATQELADLREQNAKLREALEEIRRGKRAEDNAHPLGEGWSMAIRFRNIARAALSAAQQPEQKCQHKFKTIRVGGAPDDAGSNETVRVCEACGAEDHGEE